VLEWAPGAAAGELDTSGYVPGVRHGPRRCRPRPRTDATSAGSTRKTGRWPGCNHRPPSS
jgi:hypothetical protein